MEELKFQTLEDEEILICNCIDYNVYDWFLHPTEHKKVVLYPGIVTLLYNKLSIIVSIILES